MPLFVWHPRPADVRLIIGLVKRVLDNQQYIADRMETLVDQIERKLEMANQDIQNEINDLKAATSLIASGVGTLKTNLQTALDKIGELEAAGVSPEQVADLKAAVDGAQTIAGQFEAAADPEQPTPPVEELPDPVESTPSDDTTGTDTDAGETPVQ